MNISLLEYRQRTGAFPVALADLSPTSARTSAANVVATFRTDPFTSHGESLRYRRSSSGGGARHGFALYSIGVNFRDDNGDGRRKKKGGYPADFVFTYPERQRP
jgi:hypothetical protein